MNNKMTTNKYKEEDETSFVEKNVSYLDRHNKELGIKIINIKNHVDIRRVLRGYIEGNNYFIHQIKQKILKAIQTKFDIQERDLEVSFIERKNFGADICIRIPKIIGEIGIGYYIKDIIPKISNCIMQSEIFVSGMIDKVEQKGIYLNIKLDDRYIFEGLGNIVELGDRYGENSRYKGESVVIDYSSPNTAKHLHAGHIRSTILGHVLGNIYEANGYTVHKTNHVNDWGGFGVLIEGYLQRGDKLKHFDNRNDMLFFIYTLYRIAEKAAKSEEEFLSIDKDNLNKLEEFFGGTANYKIFKNQYDAFKKHSDIRFNNLEKGEKKEVEIWENMVNRSMEDFEKFYDILDIHQDYVIGESFYSEKGKEIILNKGESIFFSEELAQKQINLLNTKLVNKEIGEKDFENIKREIINDIGSYVVMFDNFERFVVLKGNKSSIYATRDIGAINYRMDTFSPSQIVYVVGQEQQDHFNKLFKLTNNIRKNDKVRFNHIYFGFYIDEDTKKKLSSREGAANVNKLLMESIKYFKEKYNKQNEFSEEEKDIISKSLGVGSIVYNDIKKDKKGPVLINKDINKTIQKFEESGGAYIIYASCRAKSIIRKYGEDLPKIEDVYFEKLEDIEINLISKIYQFPNIIIQSGENHDPALLAEFLYNLARDYNTYYNALPVLKGNNIYRLIITKAVAQVLDNGLKICHIKPLDRI